MVFFTSELNGSLGSAQTVYRVTRVVGKILNSYLLHNKVIFLPLSTYSVPKNNSYL